jgi:hypothetical protein
MVSVTLGPRWFAFPVRRLKGRACIVSLAQHCIKPRQWGTEALARGAG